MRLKLSVAICAAQPWPALCPSLMRALGSPHESDMTVIQANAPVRDFPRRQGGLLLQNPISQSSAAVISALLSCSPSAGGWVSRVIEACDICMWFVSEPHWWRTWHKWSKEVFILAWLFHTNGAVYFMQWYISCEQCYTYRTSYSEKQYQ